jgi:hypothetical protein
MINFGYSNIELIDYDIIFQYLNFIVVKNAIQTISTSITLNHKI